jgi:hypothetical protein
MKKDITGAALDKMVEITQRALEQVDKKIPMGPGVAEMNTKEAVKKLAGTSAGRKELIRLLGPQRALEELRKVHGQ